MLVSASYPRDLLPYTKQAVTIMDETIAAPTAKGYPRLLNAVRRHC